MSKSLKSWVKSISENELPIFNYTINAINDVVSDEDTSISDLAQIILRDASLTARVLRVANSVRYNMTGSPISTISRAIVFIGFNIVRDISMSLAIIDALLTGDAKKHQMELMANSFHAAVQAQNFAERRGDDAAEEIFIAALLRHIGEMSFWCVAGEEGEKINSLIEDKGLSPQLAQQEILGFTFDQLTIELTQDWHLSDLLHSAINKPKLDNPRIKDIILSEQLSRAASQSWDSDDTNRIKSEISSHIGVPASDINDVLCENANKAVEVAQLFGAGVITKFLPAMEPALIDEEVGDTFNPDRPEADPILQLNILRDLSGMLETKPNFNVILEIILEGIYRGVGLDRTIFAILSPDKNNLYGKYALGKNNQEFVSRFRFRLEKQNIFSETLFNQKPVWIKDVQSSEVKHLIDSDTRINLASRAFFLAPISVSGKTLGVIYADRKPSNRELDTVSFESFKHFAQQASQAIEYIMVKK